MKESKPALLKLVLSSLYIWHSMIKHQLEKVKGVTNIFSLHTVLVRGKSHKTFFLASCEVFMMVCTINDAEPRI